MRRWLLSIALFMSLAGCQSGAANKLPYDAWYLGFLAPNYMEVWLEQANIGDNSGRIFPNAMGGVVSYGKPENLAIRAEGWPERIGSGKGRTLTGLDLPYVISLRWQSMVEPQTYHALFTIPDWARAKMVERIPDQCPSGYHFDYREPSPSAWRPAGWSRSGSWARASIPSKS